MEIYPTTEDTASKIVHATRINKSHVYYDCDVKECAKKTIYTVAVAML